MCQDCLLGGWNEAVCNREETDEMKDFYYSDFIDFISGCGNSNGIQVFRRSRMTGLTIQVNGHEYSFEAGDLHLYIFPFNIVVFSIKTVHRNVQFSDLTDALGTLRNICYYNRDTLGGFTDAVIHPICEVYECLRGPYSTTSRVSYDGTVTTGYPFLMENGNKFKLFHILATDEYPSGSDELDRRLFEAGTLTREGSYNGDDFMSSSKKYFESTIQSSKISIFNNWTALALFDTFTILSGSTKEYLITNWETDYFGKIYLYCLFRKFYLFRLNTLFRKKGSNLHNLKDEFIQFEREYCFPKISYNFLPCGMMSHMDDAFDIVRDKNEMQHMLLQENQRRGEAADKRMNNLLFFMTCLTIFSAVWDLGCLLDSMYPFEISIGSTMIGFRIVTTVLLLITVLFALVNRFRKG